MHLLTHQKQALEPGECKVLIPILTYSSCPRSPAHCGSGMEMKATRPSSDCDPPAPASGVLRLPACTTMPSTEPWALGPVPQLSQCQGLGLSCPDPVWSFWALGKPQPLLKPQPPHSGFVNAFILSAGSLIKLHLAAICPLSKQLPVLQL